MGTLLIVIGGVWALIGGGNIVGMPWTSGASGILTMGLMFNMLVFVFPGLILVGLGSRMRSKKQEKADHNPAPITQTDLPDERECPFCGTRMSKGFTWCRNCNKPLPKHLDTPEERECPFCAELIKAKAIKCKHCGSEVNPLPEKERTVAKKVIQETQASKSEPIKVQPIKSEKQESRPPKKEFVFPKKEFVFVLIILGGGLSFAAYTQFTHDQNESSTPKAQVIDTTKELIDRAKALVSEEKYEEAIQYIDKQGWNSELAKLKTSIRIMLARKNIQRLEPLVHKDRKANDIKLLYANYLELASLDYKNTDMQAYNRAERMRNTIIEKELLAEVKKVPSSDIEKNINLYSELTKLNPDNKIYKEKLDYYKNKKMTGSNRTVGRWIDTSDFALGEIVITKADSDYFLFQKFPDGSSRSTTLRITRRNNAYGFLDVNSNDRNEYYIINSSGNLDCYDRDGYITSLNNIK